MTFQAGGRASPSDPRTAFTLVELLVVIAIIALLIALLLPAVQTTREAGRRTTCANNIRQLGLGVSVYHDARRSFPPHLSPGGMTGVSWLSLILPHIEQQAIFDRLKPASPSYQDPENASLGRNRIGTFLCPSTANDRSAGSTDNLPGFGLAYTTHYVGNMGPIGTSVATGAAYPMTSSVHGNLACGGMLPLSPTVVTANPPRAVGVRVRDVTDGTSKTLLAFEASWKGLETFSYRSWVRGICWAGDANAAKNVRDGMRVTAYNGVPASSTYNNVSMGSEHPGGCQVAMADASVRFLSATVDLNRVLLPLASRAGGEAVTND